MKMQRALIHAVELIRILLAVGLIAFSLGCVNTQKSSQQQVLLLERVTEDLESGRASRIAIYSLPTAFESPGSVDPEALVGLSRSFPKGRLTGPVPSGLLPIIQATRLHETKSRPDLRWGLQILDKDGHIVHELYLDRWGTTGIFDGNIARVNRPLIRWLRQHIREARQFSVERGRYEHGTA
jgi:hypothetical protein